MKKLCILWTNVASREAMTRAVIAALGENEANVQISILVDDGRYWLGEHKYDVLVYATTINHYKLDDRTAELNRTRGLEYVAVSTEHVTQDEYHKWCDAYTSKFPFVKPFDPKYPGPHFEELMQSLSN